MADVGWTTNLVEGMAALLAAAGAGTWSPGGTYTDGQTGITVGVIPQAPDRIICLSPYPVDDPPGLLDVTVAVQVRVRGTTDPRVVQDIADAVYDALHGAQPGQLGGVLVAQVFRQSASSLGVDQVGRWERSENYYVQATRPSHNAI